MRKQLRVAILGVGGKIIRPISGKSVGPTNLHPTWIGA